MLIVCCGNPDRGDDAAGPLVAQHLRAMGVPACLHGGEALSLMDTLEHAAEAILVDAAVTGRSAGAISVWNAAEADPANARLGYSTHSLGVAEAIGIARVLGRLPGSLVIYGIEAGHFEAGRRPSIEVVNAAEEVARRIAAKVSHA